MKKLMNKKGETLTEALVAILIVTLSAAMLATMIIAAVNINRKANAATEKLYKELSAAESKTGGDEGRVYIGTEEVTVNYYRLEDGALTAYGRR